MDDNLPNVLTTQFSKCPSSQAPSCFLHFSQRPSDSYLLYFYLLDFVFLQRHDFKHSRLWAPASLSPYGKHVRYNHSWPSFPPPADFSFLSLNHSSLTCQSADHQVHHFENTLVYPLSILHHCFCSGIELIKATEYLPHSVFFSHCQSVGPRRAPTTTLGRETRIFFINRSVESISGFIIKLIKWIHFEAILWETLIKLVGKEYTETWEAHVWTWNVTDMSLLFIYRWTFVNSTYHRTERAIYFWPCLIQFLAIILPT